MKLTTFLTVILVSTPIFAQSKVFEEKDLNQEEVTRLECSDDVCILVPTGKVLSFGEQEPSNSIEDNLEELDRRFPWLPIRDPKPDPNPDLGKEPVAPTPEPDPKPPEVEDKYLFPILGRLFWGFMNMKSVQIILTIVGLALLSQSVMKPIYGEAWVKGLVLDVVTQIKGIVEGVFEAFSKNKEE